MSVPVNSSLLSSTREHGVQTGVAAPQVLVSAVTLAAFGVTGAMLGGANVFKGGARVVIGGLAAMGITFGFGRIFASSTAHLP